MSTLISSRLDRRGFLAGTACAGVVSRFFCKLGITTSDLWRSGRLGGQVARVPGMPIGTPGMAGPKEEPFTIYEISEGEPRVFNVE